MTKLAEHMGHHHRECDDLFNDLDRAADQADWPQAERVLKLLCEALEVHFRVEEQLIFPRFEAAMGMVGGPTQVMRSEHGQMRELLDSLRLALEQRDREAFLGDSETLLVLMQQHNMKEENVLYPMCDVQLQREMSALEPQIVAGLQGGAR